MPEMAGDKKMKYIDDERWNEMWSEKILTSQQVLLNAGDNDMAKIFGIPHKLKIY